MGTIIRRVTILALGNRMAFPIASASYRPMFERKKTIRIEVDPQELVRDIPNAEGFCVDLNAVLNEWNDSVLNSRSTEWLETCEKLQQILNEQDTEEPVLSLAGFLQSVPSGIPLVADVGNNEFWVSRAYALSKASNRIMYSRSFGTLGCALPKAIGVYHRTHKPTICFSGDQGVQFNLQELQTLKNEQLPILVVICNNRASGMIRDREMLRYGGKCVHTTEQSGYGTPDFVALAKAYGVEMAALEFFKPEEWIYNPKPMLLELPVPYNATLQPSLPKGAVCQDMAPPLDKDLYDKLNRM